MREEKKGSSFAAGSGATPHLALKALLVLVLVANLGAAPELLEELGLLWSLDLELELDNTPGPQLVPKHDGAPKPGGSSLVEVGLSSGTEAVEDTG